MSLVFSKTGVIRSSHGASKSEISTPAKSKFQVGLCDDRVEVLSSSKSGID